MKILLVEDEHRIAHYLKKGLELKSYVVDVAYDGDTGWDLATSEKYDLLILDRMLPGKDGVQLCQDLRKQHNSVPILILTAKSQIDDKVEGLDAGADDYLAKPFAFSELLARIRALTRRQPQLQNTVIQKGDLEIDTAGYTVKRDQVPIPLSRKEFSLLEFLVRHEGQVFSKEQISEQVWSFDSDIVANTAQVYIGYLRNKIDRAFPQKPALIKTVRGFGYTFNSQGMA